MKATTHCHAFLLAVALATAALTGCTDVRQNPPSNTVAGQPGTGASQAAAGQSQSPSNVPF